MRFDWADIPMKSIFPMNNGDIENYKAAISSRHFGCTHVSVVRLVNVLEYAKLAFPRFSYIEATRNILVPLLRFSLNYLLKPATSQGPTQRARTALFHMVLEKFRKRSSESRIEFNWSTVFRALFIESQFEWNCEWKRGNVKVKRRLLTLNYVIKFRWWKKRTEFLLLESSNKSNRTLEDVLNKWWAKLLYYGSELCRLWKQTPRSAAFNAASRATLTAA